MIKRQLHLASKTIKYSPQVNISVSEIKDPSSDPQKTLVVKGPLGQLSMPLQNYISINHIVASPDCPKKLIKVLCSSEKDEKHKAMWGTTWALLNRMIDGVNTGYTLPLRLSGIGYRAALENDKLVMRVGFSHPVYVDLVPDIQVIVPNPQRILLKGIDWHKVTLYAANIRKIRPPEPYNLKGIFVGDETIKKKTSKKGK